MKKSDCLAEIKICSQWSCRASRARGWKDVAENKFGSNHEFYLESLWSRQNAKQAVDWIDYSREDILNENKIESSRKLSESRTEQYFIPIEHCITEWTALWENTLKQLPFLFEQNETLQREMYQITLRSFLLLFLILWKARQVLEETGIDSINMSNE